ncbi:N-alpha-acetyltransferase 40 isoform X2 [Maniola jurtina]|uniref:N-alpha-acetyltransferase 40 isoform X1 n=1 Tax=Maniola jurtina TaxID=191418 RepID=UPI001E687A01|nr:N-alpha-acetyltransferase 40 isoform X1 [Maniola jurtina]XP_045776681.1 N-alpha-acetyltransferase 40 isoform X2 [Maniola jurtina]
MGKKSTTGNKNKEKRQARKLEQRRIADGMSFVTSANKLKDLSPLCQDLLVYNNLESMEINMCIQRVTELDKDVLNWAISLTERNMKRLYETCAWGWNKERKVEEMTDDAAWYLIARNNDNILQAFSHFRFDMDFGEPVLYCYEVQIEEGGRRKGLGQRVMQVLERLARATHMRCVRLTALTHNPSAAAFFKACGYSIDETSPAKEYSAHYEILSKYIEPTEDQVPSTDSSNRIELSGS